MSSGLILILCVTIAVICQNQGAPTGGCAHGEDIFNILYNSSVKNTEEYGVEGAVGFTGSRQELLEIINKVKANFSLAELEACLNLFVEPSFNLPQNPTSSGASNLGYNRPGHLGGVHHAPVPKPPSESFTYGHGYTSYMNPFHIGHNVKEYTPNEYMQANSIQDLLAVFYDKLQNELSGWTEWTNIFDGGLTPKFWNNYPD